MKDETVKGFRPEPARIKHPKPSKYYRKQMRSLRGGALLNGKGGR